MITRKGKVNAENFDRDAATIYRDLMDKLQNLKFEKHFFNFRYGPSCF